MQNGYDPVSAREIGQAMLALLILGLLWGLSRAWCSRVERRMVISPRDSFRRAYGRLLWRECWRSLVLTVLMGMFFAVGGRDAEDAGRKMAFVTVLYPLLFIGIAATAWRATKRLFRDKVSIASSAPALGHPHPSNATLQRLSSQSSGTRDSRIREQISKLNGWQRAWVVFGIIWTMFVGGLVMLGFPENPEHKRDRVRAIYGLHAPMPAEQVGNWVDAGTVPVTSELTRKIEKTKEIESEYEADRTQYPQEVKQHCEQAVLWWTLPLILVYLLGLGIAWVRAGFRQKRPEAH
jgi:hypothetical protein